jgi:hypothetical protein
MKIRMNEKVFFIMINQFFVKVRKSSVAKFSLAFYKKQVAEL